MKKMNKKGFTLAELLIVVAIIAVLVAIAIPVFTAQLKKSENATDLANTRSAYAEAVADALADGASLTTSGKMAISFTDPCKHGKATYAGGVITVTHSKDNGIKGSFAVDSDVTVTIK